MARIELATTIAAPPERCFDLSLSVELHLESESRSGERVVGGVRSGTLGLGDEVTWEARHFGRRRRMSVRISEWDRPRHFRDEMVTGPFRRFVHDHDFEAVDGGTRMVDRLEVATWAPPFDRLVLAPYFRRLLTRRNETIRRHAESAT